MATMYVRHQVADFKTWKPVFDEHDATRKEFGCKSSSVFTNTQNPNEVLSVFEWDSKDHAIKFGQSPGLKDAMERGGVVSAPDISFAE